MTTCKQCTFYRPFPHQSVPPYDVSYEGICVESFALESCDAADDSCDGFIKREMV